MRYLLALFPLLLTACNSASLLAPTATPTIDPCAPELVSAAIEEADGIYARFRDATDLAGSTPRMSLAPMIADMQAIRRDAEAMEMPPCLQDMHKAMIASMNGGIDALQSFLADEDDDVTTALLDVATELAAKYNEERAKALGEHALPQSGQPVDVETTTEIADSPCLQAYEQLAALYIEFADYSAEMDYADDHDSRIALTNMERVYRVTQALDVPDCAQEAHDRVLVAMDKNIILFDSALNNKGAISEKSAHATYATQKADEALAELRESLP
jgi:hypothetical protein